MIFTSQYGFRAKHSCENAIEELVANIVKGFENQKHTAAVFLDLSKAFDTIDHKILLKKLDRYGVRGIANDWFKSYLENRTLRVKLEGENGNLFHSQKYPIHLGTPQGSCLGPLLFLIYTNDLHLHVLHGLCILFADDTTIYKSSQNLNYLRWCLEEDLKSVSNWFRAHKLMLNVEKSALVFFNKNKKYTHFDLSIDGCKVPQYKFTKFLGVWIDKKLNWLEHTNRLYGKLS